MFQQYRTSPNSDQFGRPGLNWSQSTTIFQRTVSSFFFLKKKNPFPSFPLEMSPVGHVSQVQACTAPEQEHSFVWRRTITTCITKRKKAVFTKFNKRNVGSRDRTLLLSFPPPYRFFHEECCAVFPITELPPLQLSFTLFTESCQIVSFWLSYSSVPLSETTLFCAAQSFINSGSSWKVFYSCYIP